jgi:hypothetical protein
VLAYSSSRIHIIDVTGEDVVVKRELKILRRPASTTITDDGSLLAVLSTDLQIDLYDLTGETPKHTRAIALDHTPRTIALSPTGSVLAAAYDSGVEVSSLDQSYQNIDRRSVKCYAVDALSFSRDGTQLLGSTIQSRNPSTVILTAPYYDPGANSPEETVSALWTTSILFPNGSRDCSHAVLLPNPSDEEASWTFTYDRVFETFRAVRIDDLRNGTTYFTGPTSESATKLLPSTLPTATRSGDLVASGFQGSIWLYGVPEDLEALPVINGANSSTESGVSTPVSQLGRRNSAPSLRSSNRLRDSVIRAPQWQLLCDKFRNTFVEGRKVSSLDRVSAMNWVSDRSTSFHRERLIAVAPGVLCQSTVGEDDGMSPVDGGRISILDFDYSLNDGEKRIITIEVGMNEPQILEEEHRDLDAEVAIVRRRTVAQRRGNRNHVSRSATTLPRPVRHESAPLPNIQDSSDPYALSAGPTRRPSQQTTSTEVSETISIDELEVFDAPYSHTSPRSGTTLRRAATAAAVNRRFHPRAVAQEHIEYRRADGREEHPHESDADNWVPPPPPYSRDPVPPLPEHIQRSILAETAAANLHRANTHRAPSLDYPSLDSNTLSRSRTVASTSTSGSRRERYPFQRTLSDATATTDRLSFEEEAPRPMTSPGIPDDDIYDVSPPGTPQPTPRQAIPPAPEAATIPEPSPAPARVVNNQIPRRPVGAPASNANATTSTPKPVMLATLQQPASPIPVPRQTTNENQDPQLQSWEEKGATAPEQTPTLNTEVALRAVESEQICNDLPANPPIQSQDPSPINIDKEVPPRPNENHHLTELPPITPILPDHRENIESRSTPYPRRSETAPVVASPPQESEDGPLPIWRRTGTAPAASTQAMNEPAMSGVGMPSSDQLARLSSRRGRPAGAADPRRLSGNSNHQPHLSGNNIPTWGPGQNNPARLTPEQAFNVAQSRGQTVSHGGYTQRPNTGGHPSPSNSPYSSSPSRRISSAPNHNTRQQPHSQSNNNMRRQPSSSPPAHLRPHMQRLDTIHSVASQNEPSPYFAQKQIMMGRQPSRAERSAAKNIKDAKKRGWRASMRKEEKRKDKYGDGASSAGWTDVTVDSRFDNRETKRGGGKCVLM